jgi:hypothetical protein
MRYAGVLNMGWEVTGWLKVGGLLSSISLQRTFVHHFITGAMVNDSRCWIVDLSIGRVLRSFYLDQDRTDNE